MGNKKSKFAEPYQEYPDVISVPQLCKMLGVCKGKRIPTLCSGKLKYFRLEQILTLNKHRLLGYIGTLPVSQMEWVNNALRCSFEL